MSFCRIPVKALATAVTGLWLFVACVDTTPPWEKAAGRGGAGGGSGLDGATSGGGALDGGGAGRLDVGAGDWDGALGDAWSGIDAAGGAGGLDADRDGASGGIDGSAGQLGIDAPLGGSGGATSIDGGPADVPLGGARTGGATGSGGTSARGGAGGTVRTGGTTGAGGTVRTGGTTGTGGTVKTGGTTGTGGAAGSGGTTTPDAAPDLGPDLSPDTSTLGNGLVARYACDETGGTTLADSSGNGHHGTLSGTASFGAGKVGRALVLTASGSGYVSLPPAVFSGLGDFTIATWMNVATHVDWQRVFDTGINANQDVAPISGTKYMNLTSRNSSGNLRWSISQDGMLAEESLNTPSPPAATWTHVTVVLTGGRGHLFIDGNEVEVADSETEATPSSLGAIDYAYLGKSQFSVDPYFDGMLDEFRVYNRALSAAEVAALHQFGGP